MVPGANTVRNPIMKRIEIHNTLSVRKVFYNREAFLTFVYSPNPNVMSTYFPSQRREFHYGVILFLSLLPLTQNAQEQSSSLHIKKYVNQAEDQSLSLGARKKSLHLAYRLISKAPDDSLKYARLSKIVESSSYLQDSILFHHLAKEGLTLAKDMDRPHHLGDAHWNYGAYYLRIKNYDSSYVHYNSAYKYFTAAHNQYYAAKMLYNMAYIAGQTHDFTGAEILLFRSIKIFEKHNKSQQLYRCYNLLGNHADDMEEFDKSLTYYNKASRLLSQLDDREYYRLQHWNNLGVRLYKMKLYEEAIPYFTKALAHTDKLQFKPALYAKLLDNLAYSKVSLGNYDNVEEPMQRAMTLHDSIGDKAGTVTNTLRFANYYGKIGDTLTAIEYASQALKLAEKNHFTPEVLLALEMLAVLDANNAVYHLQRHLQLDKQLNARDRNLRNKFTAIQYETNKYIQENEKLFRQRLWISVVAVAISLILLLIYWNAQQRTKNKQLLFEREQQQLNEDLFLMALEQKNNLEKGRKIERHRISRELHDAVISKILSIRLRLEQGYFAAKNKATIEKIHLEQLQEVETEIRNISHNLKSNSLWYDHDFLEIMEKVIKEKSEMANFEYVFHKQNPEAWEGLDDITKIHLSRMLDEILQNIYKYAACTLVKASFTTIDKNLLVTITDNGRGFNQTKANRGIGLKNLQDRTMKINGTLNINSQKGGGTTIRITIPLNS